ncbi:prenyltransferase [Photorhabdus antumapuensis]|uniref:prenyltransferase n=1 Tax=Photorhabdus antumapuensis TaxID=2862867 RepID=UPI001CECF80F|nr:prenyltransferase [Photorhabdus antumapuensis]MCA6220577.1 prenyltransferase [Photorhabdus antumapuensis]
MEGQDIYSKFIGKRIKLWMDERFPLQNAPLFFIFYIISYSVAFYSIGEKPVLSWEILLGCLMSFSYFLLLRIFDEHKDYQLDCEHHPQRILQRGIITLKNLRVLGICCIALQLGGSLFLDRGIGSVTFAWLLVFIWTCLMGKEFFIGEWLNQHLTWYAISHMLVMPLIIWWLGNIASPNLALTFPIWVLMGLCFFSGFSFEITRKCKGPDEERLEIPTYSSIFGRKGAVAIIAVLLTVMLILQIWLLHITTDGIALWALIILVVCYALCLWQLSKFLRNPTIQNRKRDEAVVGIFMVLGYSVCAASILIKLGFA